jgi:acyl-CoA thioester hydrolase
MRTVDGEEFRWRLRVYYEDTDAGGIVYYANYLKFFERCRTEWLRALDLDPTRLLRETGVQFVVREAACEFRRPARLDDALVATARVARVGGASLTFAQQLWRDAGAAGAPALLAEAKIRVACVDARNLAPAPLPKTLAAALRRRDAPA